MLKIFKKNVCLAVALSLLIILSALWTNAFVQGFREETTIMVVKFVFVKPEVKEKDSSTEITMEGLSSYGEEGKPVLPFKNVKLLIPYSKTVREVRVAVGSKETITFKQPIEHGQAPIPFIDGGKLDYTPQNETLYNSSEPYPNELFSEYTIQYLRGYKLLIFNLYPVQYIPSLEMIFWYKSMRAEVVLDSSANKDKSPVMGIRGIECDREIVMSAVDNKEVIETYPQKTSSLNGTSYRYVIITNEVLKNSKEQYNWQALTAYKESKGITTNIVTVEEIYKNYDGKRPDGKTDNQTKIRNFIIDAYTNWKTEYILLGGDGDVKDVGGESGNNIIPVRHFYSRFRVDHPIPADMYYSNLDGTFDFDKDGYYGEPADGIDGGEVDLYSEVFIGRAPVDSEKELSNFVRKTLEYENASDDYLKSVWMVGELLWPGTYGGDYKDEIGYGSSAHGYTTVGFPEQFNIQTLYDRDGRWDKEKLISIINSNVHLINHLGHANLNYVMKMVNQDVDRLTNDKYFFAYSQGCLPGAFDNWNTHTGKYTKEDSIAEHLTTNSTGAFAVIMNTRYGWGKRGSTDGPSQRYDRQFWDAIFGEKIDKLGKANQDSKEDNIGYLLAGDGVMRWCYYEITLFGDPELSLKSCFEPKISSISPSTGYVTAKVTITGKNFGKLDSSSSVIFNGTKAKNIIFWSDTEIKVEVPKGALSGTVVVTTSSGASKSDTIFTVIKVVGQELLTDINLNGTVDNDDFCILANDFMKPKPTNIRSDINGDGMVDKIDSDLLVSDFGKSATLITDLNRDYKVDIYDLALVSGVLGKNPSVRPEADVNRDGKIDIADLNRVNEDFGRSAYMISHYLKYTDINRDEVVDYKDLLIVAKAFNSSSTIDPRADLNRDNFVNLSDANLTMRDMEIERRNETYAEYSIADINRDGQVNGLDFSILAMDYGKSRPQNPRSDINGDGIVNWPDYSLLIKYYRKIATLITDINEDYKVDIYDGIEVAKAIGQKPRYKPRADVNRDKKIDAEDFKLFVMDFGKSKEDITTYLLPTDLNRDKKVDYNDLLIVAKAFNSSSALDPRADVNLDGYINSYDANLVIRDMSAPEKHEIYAEYSIADINRDGIVNNTDLLILKRDYLSTSQTRADINGDGIVNALDFSILAMYWLKEALLITDINSDYKVDIYDAVEVAKVIGQKPRYKPRADVNRDTKIDVEDFKLVVMDFGKSKKDITKYLLPTDLNRDKKVDYNDLLIVAKVCYNHSYIDPRADVNLNHYIDSNDANLVIRDMIKSQQNETYGEFSIADINRDGVVNITDYSILIKNYGNLEEKRADINGDEIVNATDYSILSKYWLKKATLITDINGDYKVNVVDVVEVAKAIGKEPSYRPRADINRDGKIDVEDFKLVVIDFGKTTNNITKYLLPTDLNRDSTVDITDIEIVKSAMDISPIKDQRADVNFDGVVNFYDLNLVQRDGNAKSIKNWTYMVYLDADNNLESAGIDDFLEMSAVGSAKEVNILVQMDRIRRHDSSHDDWTTTKRYYVEKGMVPNVTNALADIGEANMGDPNTLVNFVKFGIENYPAEHYVVVLWNHGGGWSYGVCVDDTDGHDMLSSDELKTAFIQIRDYLGKPIDIIGYDACLMGNTEIMYQHKATADYVIASAEVEGWDGWEYTGILSDLVAKPSMKPAELGKVHIDRNIPTNDIKTMIFIDNKIFDYPLMEALNNLSQKLRHVAGSYKGGITSARDTATGFYYPNLKDIYSLVQSLEKNVLDNSVKEAARKVIEILNAFQYGSDYPGAHGISIEFGWRYSNAYNNLYFAKETSWDEFLWAFFEGRDYPNIEPSIKIELPRDGSTIYKTNTISVSGTAFDTDGVVQWVEVKIDREDWVRAEGNSSWKFNLDTTNLQFGQHKLFARAFDGNDYSSWAVHTINYVPKGTLKGDVNMDGKITIVDAMFIAQYIAGLRSLTSEQLYAADVATDCKITETDAKFIAQYLVGTRGSLSVITGDVDFDSKLTEEDAMLVSKYALGFTELTPLQKDAGDVNGDGKVDFTDAQLIAQFVKGTRSAW